MPFYVKIKNAEGIFERVEVTKEVYSIYYVSRRKEKYFLKDLKEETFKVIQDRALFLPSKEDSLERLIENQKQFTDLTIDIETDVIQKEMVGKLLLAINSLTTEEQELIHNIFYLEISEVDLSKEYGVARTTLQSRKYKILEKLKKLL